MTAWYYLTEITRHHIIYNNQKIEVRKKTEEKMRASSFAG
jgi:hypothetical protein